MTDNNRLTDELKGLTDDELSLLHSMHLASDQYEAANSHDIDAPYKIINKLRGELNEAQDDVQEQAMSAVGWRGKFLSEQKKVEEIKVAYSKTLEELSNSMANESDINDEWQILLKKVEEQKARSAKIVREYRWFDFDGMTGVDESAQEMREAIARDIEEQK